MWFKGEKGEGEGISLWGQKQLQKEGGGGGWEVGRALSEYAQVVLLVASAEGVSCQNS